MSCWCCPECGYRYDEDRGDAHEGFAPGTRFTDLPKDWHCPDCGIIPVEEFEPAPDDRSA